MATKKIRRTIPCKDYYGNELHVGDRVTFLYKAYGYRKIDGVYFAEGIIEKLPEQELCTWEESDGKGGTVTKEQWYSLNDGNVTIQCGGIKRVPGSDIILHK